MAELTGNGSSRLVKPAGRRDRFRIWSLLPPLPYGRMAKWTVVWLGAIFAWTLMVLAAVWQGPFLILFFPAGWSLHAALRQYRDLRDDRMRGVATARG